MSFEEALRAVTRKLKPGRPRFEIPKGEALAIATLKETGENGAPIHIVFRLEKIGVVFQYECGRSEHELPLEELLASGSDSVVQHQVFESTTPWPTMVSEFERMVEAVK